LVTESALLPLVQKEHLINTQHSFCHSPQLSWGFSSVIKKIKDIVLDVVKSYPEINLIVLPEYSVPDECFDFLKNISDEKNIIIVGGSHYSTEKFKNLSPLFIPNNEIIFVEKDKISPFESELHFSAKEEIDACYHKKFIELQWGFNGSKYSIQVFICSDFLDSVPHINLANPGVIISPLCTPHINSFYGLSEYLIRLPVPKFVCFANTVTSPLSEFAMAGKSGIACSSNKGVSSYYQLSNVEEVLYSRLNLSNARLQKPTAIGSRLPVSKKAISSIACVRGNYCLTASCLPELQQRSVINPDLFRATGKKFRIFYLTCDHYSEIFDELNKCPSYSASALGNVDIIIRNINDGASKAWLYDFHQAAHRFKEKDWNYFSVNRFLKYEGVVVASGVNAIDTPPSPSDLTTIVKLVSGVEDILDNQDLDRFIENNWIIGDVEDCEKRKNIRVIVNIFLPEIAPTNDISERFEHEVIDKYLNNNSISGIYEGTSRGLQTNYVFELCCDVIELFGIVESLHANCKKKNIKITTKTNLISQRFSTDLYSNLLLTSVPYEISSTIDNYILKDLGIDLCQKLREKPLEFQTDFAKFYIKMNRFHGIVKKYYNAEQRIDRRNKYTAILDIIEDTKKLFSSYLIQPNNLLKASSGFQNLFIIFDTCLQQILINIREIHFNGNDLSLITHKNIPDRFKLKSTKKELKRLTFRERVDLLRGFLANGEFKESIPFNEDNFLGHESLQKMINYRNTLTHFKQEEVNKIDKDDWKEIIIWMLKVITNNENKLLQFIENIWTDPHRTGVRDVH